MGIFRRDYKKVDSGAAAPVEITQTKQEESIKKLIEMGYKPSEFNTIPQQVIQQQEPERFKYTTPVVEVKDKDEEYFIYELSRIKEEIVNLRRQITYLETRIDMLLKYFKE